LLDLLAHGWPRFAREHVAHELLDAAAVLRGRHDPFLSRPARGRPEPLGLGAGPAGSAGPTSRPVSPSLTTSRPPARLPPTIARPRAPPSTATRGSPS